MLPSFRLAIVAITLMAALGSHPASAHGGGGRGGFVGSRGGAFGFNRGFVGPRFGFNRGFVGPRVFVGPGFVGAYPYGYAYGVSLPILPPSATIPVLPAVLTSPWQSVQCDL
jgi:hypothetical protein